LEVLTMSTDPEKTAFIIMPFGEKTDAQGNAFNFDAVYDDVIKEPLEDLGFKPLRCDEITRAGSIHQDMFTHIATAAVAVVDITMLNPNVFYELGVRHSLRPSVTVLIKKRGTHIPFNIQSERIIEYPSASGSNREAGKVIRQFIEAGLESSKPDSPIFNILQDVRKDAKKERITQQQRRPFRLASQPEKRLVIITGDIRDYDDIDVWVNSENTNMQMSRYYDKTLSAMIRYEGAEKDENGEVVADTIADELAARLKGKNSVTPGTIYVTGSGALAQRGVKKIFHAATVCGVPGSGYQCIQNVEQCVANALRRIDHPQLSGDELRSIVFPMMGTGAGGMRVEEVAPRLIETAVCYLQNTPESRVQTIYFSAWNYADLDACVAALKGMKEVEPVT
jgi:O-acetyl-ADP-ribose deacetylase (regulator of RNase III)